MNNIISVQFTTFNSVSDLDEWKTLTFGNDDEYNRWSRTIHASLSLIVDSFLISKMPVRGGYRLSGGFLAYDPISDAETFCVACYEVLVPHGESLDVSPVKRQFLSVIRNQLGVSFTRKENGEWLASAAS